jgi:phytoene dehydrogenase-like protein
MAGDNVLADHFHLPARYDRKILFKLGSDQYRTPVTGLYLCGAATFPGGGVHGACGYNAYQAIAEDFDLPAVSADRRSPASGR